MSAKKGVGRLPFLVHCWGDYACFTRPEFRTERFSYDVMTPSAARGILEAIYWHPGVTWHVQKIWVCKPIKFMNFQRIELKTLMSTKALINAVTKNEPFKLCNADEQSTIRSSTVLRDVEYYIQADIDVDSQICDRRDNDIRKIIVKRLTKGKCYHRPYFGCREFPAHFELATSVPNCPADFRGCRDLGWMFWDYDYTKQRPQPIFFHPYMINGLIEITQVVIPKGGELS